MVREQRVTGVPASPSGHSAEPEPSCTVSAVPVSVPNAVLPFQAKDRPAPKGQRPVYRWEIDSAFLPEHRGAAWEVIGFRDG